MEPEAASGGLRERKKQQTRESIATAAMQLFDQRGFDQTTVADIAAAADVAPRTFFSYYPSKESVVFHDFDEILNGLRIRLREREAGESAVDALRGWLVMMIDQLEPDDPMERCRRRLIQENPSLTVHDRTKIGEMEVAIADAVSVDLGEKADALRPRLVAAAAGALLLTLETFYDDQDGGFKVDDPELMETLDEALDFLRGGMETFLSAKRG